MPARRRVHSRPRHPAPPPSKRSSQAKTSTPRSRLPRNGVAAYYSKCYCSSERGCIQEQAISCLKCSGTSAMCTFFHGVIRVAGAGDKRTVCSGWGCWVGFLFFFFFSLQEIHLRWGTHWFIEHKMFQRKSLKWGGVTELLANVT